MTLYKNKCLDCGGLCCGKMYCKKCYVEHTWQKGLTKETDERIKKMAEIKSKTTKGKKPWNKDIHYKYPECWSDIKCRGCGKIFSAINWEHRVYCSYDCYYKKHKGSIPQEQLHNIIKELFKNYNVLYEQKIENSRIRLDVSVPELKIDFEYDGSRWHVNKNIDNKRDLKLTGLGWTVFRYNKNNFLKENILKDIEHIGGITLFL